MKALPVGLEERDLVTALAAGWGMDVMGMEYAPVGFGSYHWLVSDQDGTRHFATADDLSDKSYLGDTSDAAFAALRLALDTALALRERGGLAFVAAPIPMRSDGGSVLRLDGGRYAVAVYRLLDGRFPHPRPVLTAGERAELVRHLARLHGSAAPARPIDPVPASRARLEVAMGSLDREWSWGPYSESARALLTERGDGVRRLLATFDQLLARVRAVGAPTVVTHGEPHTGNVVRTETGLVLVDWDTLGLALPERDLWMVDGDEELRLYERVSGRLVDPDAIELYRLRWKIDDIASFTGWFRAPHVHSADTEHGWRAMVKTVEDLP